MKIINLINNKYFKFFFPTLSICMLIIFGVSFAYGEIDGKSINLLDWCGMMALAFIFFIIPLDIVLWIAKKILLFFKFKSLQKCIEKTENCAVEPEPIITQEIEMQPQKNKLVVDPYFKEAGKLVIEKEKASIGMMQRAFKIGFNRASKIMDQLGSANVVGPEIGTAPRRVLMTNEEFQNLPNVFDIEYEDLNEYSTKENIEENFTESAVPIPERILMYNNKFDYMEGHDFEEYCAVLLKNIGYQNVEVTKGSNDNGIDILATLGGVKYGIQCKCYSSDIGVKAVQEAYAGAKYYNCHVPVVLTNQYFTRQAQDLAECTNVLLWDRSHLIVLVDALKSK